MNTYKPKTGIISEYYKKQMYERTLLPEKTFNP